MDLETLTREGLITAPFDYVRRNSHRAFGVDGLHEELYSSRAYVDEFVTREEIVDKTQRNASRVRLRYRI